MSAERGPTYGGQAVLEGVMIRGPRHASVAVRRPDGSIAIQERLLGPLFIGPLRRWPLVRGVIVLIETLSLGMWALSFSANVSAEGQGEEVGKGSMALMVAFSLIFAIGLFFMVPVFASRGLEGRLGTELASNLAEGVIRLGLFLGYIVLIGTMRDIKRVFMYHGAEHMTVHAQENGDPLEISAVRKYPTAHPRCGTSFLLTVMVVAVLVFAFTGRDPLWWLIASRILLVPVIAAISYEVIRFSGFHSGNILVRVITGPNLALQALTTRQPEDDQIEVAIAAMKHAMGAQERPPSGHSYEARPPDKEGQTV